MGAQNGESHRQGIQSVEISVQILAALESAGRPLTLSQTSERCGMQPSKVHRYLVSFCRAGLTWQDPVSGLYDFGPAMRRMGSEALRRTNEVGTAASHAAELRDSTGHSVNVAVWSDAGPVVAHWAYGAFPLSVTIRIGAILPLLTSSIGRVFVSHLPERTSQSAIERAREQGRLDTWTQSRIDEEIERVRTTGYAVTASGVIPGIASLAAPIFAASDPLPLAMSIVGPEDELDEKEISRLSAELVAVTQQATHELGAHQARGA
ncbi:IclR family transcriptional regulator [Aeromicrobium sp. CTD01-1L150]|uniref:IclR family transcriptional regulator n=1 Tax=Aeromicrobium sp. CTD01-1L150 TaxID=3341830 RepID=UPI0035C21EFA